MRITAAELERLKTRKGGYSRLTLKALGVPWPPPKGWKKKLLRGSPAAPKKKKKKAHKQQNTQPGDPIKAFYKSFEWKKKRYQILKRYGARCMCCGISARDGAVMNVDHIKSLRTHWHLRLDDDNLQVLCGSCNHGKGGWDSTDWREEEAEPSLSVLMGERMDVTIN